MAWIVPKKPKLNNSALIFEFCSAGSLSFKNQGFEYYQC
jgi:hypothetical protein